MGESLEAGVTSPSKLILLPLHHRPDLTISCAELLNQTWHRSMGARMHSLERSCDEFPVCLVLIGAPGGPVLGHARLCRVLGLQDSLFVESVVVSSQLRGKGYGRRLMEATEKYARSRGFRSLHLTTHDKQDFYHHLGYHLSEPVQSMGTLGTLIPMSMLQSVVPTRTDQLSNSPPTTLSPSHSHSKLSDSADLKPSSPNVSSFITSALDHPVAPAPPPPPPSFSPAPPPPPPLPSAPVLPTASAPFHSPTPSIPVPSAPPLALSKGPAHFPDALPLVKQTGTVPLLHTEYKDFRGQPIFWMRKTI
ncbi:N-alpha-acetyltransferase 80 [Rhinophrynus dorsalis]